MAKLKQSELIEKLADLFHSEHGDCEDNTCSMSIAYRLGYARIAIEDWSGTGASSPEFDELYDKLGPKFRRDYRKECREFTDEVSHADCVHCNAVVWETEYGFHCGSCGADDCRIKIVKCGLDENRDAQGKHLLEPTESELERGLEDALSDGFQTLYVHAPKYARRIPPKPERLETHDDRRAVFKLILGGAA